MCVFCTTEGSNIKGRGWAPKFKWSWSFPPSTQQWLRLQLCFEKAMLSEKATAWCFTGTDGKMHARENMHWCFASVDGDMHCMCSATEDGDMHWYFANVDGDMHCMCFASEAGDMHSLFRAREPCADTPNGNMRALFHQQE